MTNNNQDYFQIIIYYVSKLINLSSYILFYIIYIQLLITFNFIHEHNLLQQSTLNEIFLTNFNKNYLVNLVE